MGMRVLKVKKWDDRSCFLSLVDEDKSSFYRNFSYI
jgi:hypothetical protein